MDNIKERIADTVQSAEDGNISGLEVYANLKDLQRFLTDAINQVEELAWQEANNYNEKTFSEFGFRITKRNGSVTYDFKANADFKQKSDELAELRKKLSSASKNGLAYVDMETGETFEPCPVKSGSKDSLVIEKI